MDLSHALALRLLFRSEYGDPGEKGANPPAIRSEQSYHKVSSVKIIVDVILFSIVRSINIMNR